MSGESCPWCPGENTVQTDLKAGLGGPRGTQNPTLVHVTECVACGAKRKVSVRLDELDDEHDAVSGGGWTNVPGQGTLGSGG